MDPRRNSEASEHIADTSVNTDPRRALDPRQWVSAYADVLYRYAIVRVGRPDLAEDLVQETFLAALKAQEKFRGDSAQKTWLVSILRNKILDHFRVSARRGGDQGIGGDADVTEGWFDERGHWRAAPGSWEAEPGRLAEDREFWGVFHRCLEGLPGRGKEVFARRVMEDQATEEIGKELGITATNIWVILHRARAALRACLEKNWFNVDRSTNQAAEAGSPQTPARRGTGD